MKEMRKYQRFALGLSAKVKVVDSGSGEVPDAVTSDVSAGGAYFHTAEPISEGTRVRLSLIVASERLKELTGAQGLVKVGGVVVRSSSEGMAIHFDEEPQVMPLWSP